MPLVRLEGRQKRQELGVAHLVRDSRAVEWRVDEDESPDEVRSLRRGLDGGERTVAMADEHDRSEREGVDDGEHIARTSGHRIVAIRGRTRVSVAAKVDRDGAAAICRG